MLRIEKKNLFVKSLSFSPACGLSPTSDGRVLGRFVPLKRQSPPENAVHFPPLLQRSKTSSRLWRLTIRALLSFSFTKSLSMVIIRFYYYSLGFMPNCRSTELIDRISRNFITYSDFRQSMTNRVHILEQGETRHTLDMVDLTGRARFLAANAFPRAALEVALTNAHEEARRVSGSYTYSSFGFASSPAKAENAMLRGQNIDRFI
jgi:hypothetical protein